jgi:hypothetical protein
MKKNKVLQPQTKELTRAAQTVAATGFLPHPSTLAASNEPARKKSYSCCDPAPMSLREMQRWLDAEAEVIAKHELAQLNGFHNRPT